jgi:hypothetical protein
VVRFLPVELSLIWSDCTSNLDGRYLGVVGHFAMQTNTVGPDRNNCIFFPDAITIHNSTIRSSRHSAIYNFTRKRRILTPLMIIVKYTVWYLSWAIRFPNRLAGQIETTIISIRWPLTTYWSVTSDCWLKWPELYTWLPTFNMAFVRIRMSNSCFVLYERFHFQPRIIVDYMSSIWPTDESNRNFGRLESSSTFYLQSPRNSRQSAATSVILYHLCTPV